MQIFRASEQRKAFLDNQRSVRAYLRIYIYLYGQVGGLGCDIIR